MEQRPEIANSILTGSFHTNYHDVGSGFPLIMLHGSGPGVSAWANWNKVFPLLSGEHHVYALDLVGFGYTDRPAGLVYNMDAWVKQVIDFMDALKIEKADLVGNSFGGALALALAYLKPDRVRKLVLMGSMGVSFPLTYGLDRVWGYTPSLENMQELIGIFAYSRKSMPPELAKGRYEGKHPMYPEDESEFREIILRGQNCPDYETPNVKVTGAARSFIAWRPAEAEGRSGLDRNVIDRGTRGHNRPLF